MYGIQKDGDIQQIAGNSHIVADDALSTTSENPIQNKVVTNALADVVTAANEAETSTTTPRDADLLGGHAPSYFATNDSLSNTNANLSSLLVVDTTTISNVAVSANTTTAFSTNISKTGYRALGILGIYVDKDACVVNQVRLFYADQQQAYVKLRNVTSSAVSGGTIELKILWQKVL